ncbi:MAG: glycosyltransferase family 39 protein [Candidatus Sumerlaeia bacterium]|nr:glycosyltransferase family 39 protein [Candidatus Sumerlaeia bacterium]
MNVDGESPRFPWTREPHRWRPLFLVLGAWLLATLPSPFIGLFADDWFQVRPRTLAEVAATFTGDWNRGDRGLGTGFYRPLARTSFALDVGFWGGFYPGYRLASSALLLVVLAGAYRAALLLNGGRRWCAAIAAAMLAVCPLLAEGHYWLSARADLLAAAFLAWSLWAGLRAIEADAPRWAVLSVLLAMGSMLSKEVGLMAAPALVLASYLLGRRGHRAPWVLAIGAGVAAAAYLALRLHAIGGIGGYYAAAASHYRVFDLAMNLLAMLGALAAPATGSFAGAYHPASGMLWLAVGAGALAATGFHRPLAAVLGGTLLFLLPMAGLRIGPLDGTRVLACALVFQTCAAAIVLSRLAEWKFLRIPGTLWAGLLGLVWLFTTLAAAGQFLSATRPAKRAVAEAMASIDAHAAHGEREFVLRDPPDPPGERRILRPGMALFFAIQNEYVRRGGVADFQGPYLAAALDAIRVRVHVLPGADMPARVVELEVRPDGSIRSTPLDRVGAATWVPSAAHSTLRAIEPPEPSRRAAFLLDDLGAPGFHVVEFTADGGPLDGPVARWRTRAGDEVAASPLALAAPAPPALWSAAAWVGDGAAILVLDPSRRPARFQLRSLTHALYREAGPPADSEGTP